MATEWFQQTSCPKSAEGCSPRLARSVPDATHRCIARSSCHPLKLPVMKISSPSHSLFQ